MKNSKREEPKEWLEETRRRGGEDWYQGFPESRGYAHRDWERERDYWNPSSESQFGREREDYSQEAASSRTTSPGSLSSRSPRNTG